MIAFKSNYHGNNRFGSQHIDNSIVPISDDRGLAQYHEDYAGEVDDDDNDDDDADDDDNDDDGNNNKNRCKEHEFTCGDGECIDRRRVCDTRVDCSNGLDESQCHAAQPESPPYAESQYPDDHSNSYSEFSTKQDAKKQPPPSTGMYIFQKVLCELQQSTGYLIKDNELSGAKVTTGELKR